MPGSAILFILKCGSVVNGLPISFGDSLWCHKCNKRCEIESVHEYEWHAQCRECQWGRWTGTDPTVARQFAAGHNRRTKHMKIVVEYVKNPMAVKTTEKMRRHGIIP